MKTILITVSDDWAKGDCYICKSVGGVNPACNAKEAVIVEVDSDSDIWMNGKEKYNGKTLYAVAVDK